LMPHRPDDSRNAIRIAKHLAHPATQAKGADNFSINPLCTQRKVPA
jgi:hypothetical protein